MLWAISWNFGAKRNKTSWKRGNFPQPTTQPREKQANYNIRRSPIRCFQRNITYLKEGAVQYLRLCAAFKNMAIAGPLSTRNIRRAAK